MATQGPNSGGSFAQVSHPFGDANWSNLSNAASSNNSHATASLTSAAFGISHYVVATNFGFSIPAGSVINGITVEVERKASGSGVSDNAIYLTKNAGSDDFAASDGSSTDGASLTTSDAYVAAGTSTDLWDTTWTAEEINSNDFGAMYAAGVDGPNRTVSVDHIRITVDYTPPPSGGPLGLVNGGLAKTRLIQSRLVR